MKLASVLADPSGCPACADLEPQIRDAVRERNWLHLPETHGDCPAYAAVIGVCRDLSLELAAHAELVRQHERDTERLRHLSHFDSLTGLPNRRWFLERLEHVMADARAHRLELAVLAVDVDRLRRVNGSLGNRIGDKVLETVASRLLELLHTQETVARSAGDEFLVLLPGTAHVETVVHELLAAIAEPMEIDGYVLNVTATAGISIFPGDGLDAESLVQHAATALHRAKREGNNRFEHYNAADASPFASPFLESGLRRAVERREFVLHYQPIVDLATRQISGAEALIRWEHPHLGTLPPACFLGLAEETGMIVPLTAWTLREACAQLTRWDERDLHLGRVAVNLSAHQLRDPNFADTIARIVGDARIDPGRIELEVTETVLVADDRRSIATLHDLKARGFLIAIDDFGTGYSSLSYLQRLPVDRLKIDRAFVRDLGNGEQSAAIAELIISVARRLRLSITAEGVETAAQLEFLREHGCDEIQGYYFGEPGPPATIEFRRQW